MPPVCPVPACRNPYLFLYALAAAMLAQVLSFLFTVWNVSFNATVNYRTVSHLADAEYVKVSREGVEVHLAVWWLRY